MKLLIRIFVLWGLLIFYLEASDFPDDVFLFLPFLKNFESPPPCPENEMYRHCLTNCSTCEERGRCAIQSCSEGGCDCIPRYFRLTPEGPCQPVSLCPKPECGENEVFRECGPLCETCGTYRCRVIQCDHKCYCKQGYLRDNDGKCVPEEDCPKRTHCSRVEEWAESGPVDEYCMKVESATDSNETQEVGQCYCKEGYKRNTMGHCVHERFCALIMCVGQEIYQECVPKCNTTCRNFGDPDCQEDGQCYPGCFCPPNYVMSDSRSCVPVDECFQNSTTENPTDAYEENENNSTTTTEIPFQENDDSEDKTSLDSQQTTLKIPTKEDTTSNDFSTFSRTETTTTTSTTFSRTETTTTTPTTFSRTETATDNLFETSTTSKALDQETPISENDEENV